MKKKSSQNKNRKPKNISLSLDCFGLSNAVHPYSGEVGGQGEQERMKCKKCGGLAMWYGDANNPAALYVKCKKCGCREYDVVPREEIIDDGEGELRKPLSKADAKAARDAISKAEDSMRAAHSVLLKYAGSSDYDIAAYAMRVLLKETLALTQNASGLSGGTNAELVMAIAAQSHHWPVMVGIQPESWKAARKQIERIGLGTRIPIAEQYRNKKAFKPDRATNAIAWEILQTIIKTRAEVQQYDRNTLKHGRLNGEPVPEWVCLCRDLPALTPDKNILKDYRDLARKHIATMKAKRVSKHETAFELLLRTAAPEWFDSIWGRCTDETSRKKSNRTTRGALRKNAEDDILSALVTIAKNL
ncbi:MAG: hypothetical protein AB7T27_09605 [Kiritimatiellia bacterium]